MVSLSGLYVVATPIGNLEDISLRALDVLKGVDCIAAEDTRHSRVLMSHYGIQTKMLALHDHNEDAMATRLVESLKEGQSLALISDAGTPLISDPGYRLVRLAGDAGVSVSVIPGPSAVTAALSVSGLATDRFCFEGFLPAKKVAREKKLEELIGESRTMVFYESSHRIEETLADMSAVLGPDREAAVCRELTKKFETVKRASLSELVEWVSADPNQRKGEFVVVVSPQQDEEGLSSSAIRLARALSEHISDSQAAKIVARETGCQRRLIYQWLQEQTKDNADG